MRSFSALQRAEIAEIVLDDRQVHAASCFSALQRAENSSMQTCRKPSCPPPTVSVLFSEPKIPQFHVTPFRTIPYNRFSALQRAENSSIRTISSMATSLSSLFQCSSASRKFLNTHAARSRAGPPRVSVLFSEPKIPQSFAVSVDEKPVREFQCSSASRKFLNQARGRGGSRACRVSVLFSEPKIPQSRPSHLRPSIFPTAMITLRHS